MLAALNGEFTIKRLHQPSVLAQLAALKASLLVISFAELDYLRRWVDHFRQNILEPSYQEQGVNCPQPFERTRFLANPDRSVYHAYGLGQNSPREVYSFKILRQYARWKAAGKPVELPSQDALQRGGDFVTGPSGRLTLAHTGRNQSERPPVEEILAAMLKS